VKAKVSMLISGSLSSGSSASTVIIRTDTHDDIRRFDCPVENEHRAERGTS
jgi:hypothetical protein